MTYRKPKVPIMVVGKYAGTPIDQLPNSYLRWMLTQDFPKMLLEAAERKLKSSTESNDSHINISRHAIDMFSKRYLFKWIEEVNPDGDNCVGLASYITSLAQTAWDQGIDKSKHRHKDDGIIKEYDGLKWVFGVNLAFPDYKEVITVMDGDEVEQS